jgi:hypothetical protein
MKEKAKQLMVNQALENYVKTHNTLTDESSLERKKSAATNRQPQPLQKSNDLNNSVKYPSTSQS